MFRFLILLQYFFWGGGILYLEPHEVDVHVGGADPETADVLVQGVPLKPEITQRVALNPVIIQRVALKPVIMSHHIFSGATTHPHEPPHLLMSHYISSRATTSPHEPPDILMSHHISS